MNGRELRLFNLWAIRTKDELLGAIDEYIDRIEQHDDIEIVRKGRSKPLVDVMKDFRKKVARTPLADLDQDFCAYEVEITDTEIELSINAFKDIVVDDNGEILKSSSEVTPEIIVVSAPYIPIDQFAEMQGVKAATVRQWIRRGKIRNVKKLGSEWMVASTEGQPERGFTGGVFYCTDQDGDMSRLFPLKEGTHSIELWKANQYSEECLATMRDFDHHVLDEIKLNRVAREKLEHALAASPEVRFQSTFIDVIDRKASSSRDDANSQPEGGWSDVAGTQIDDLSIDCLLKEISGDGYVRDLAISLAHLCFRNGPVEDMHAEGKLDDTDMMELNKYMVDHLGLFLLLLGLSDFSSLKRILWFHDQCGSDWDSPDVQKMLHDYHISTDRLKALAFNRDQAAACRCSSNTAPAGLTRLAPVPSSDHDPDEPLADCPICGSNVLIRKPMTNLSFAVDHGKTVHTNKELANAAHVPIQLVTDMQFVERVKSASEKQRERMKAVADVLDVPLDYLLAFNPNASTISCGDCHTTAPWSVWSARRPWR